MIINNRITFKGQNAVFEGEFDSLCDITSCYDWKPFVHGKLIMYTDHTQESIDFLFEGDWENGDMHG